MAMTYKKYPIPITAWNNFKVKQKKMSIELSRLSGKKRNVPLSRVLQIASEKPLFLDDEELKILSKKKGSFRL